ncbi:uncharacterized protein LOC122932036 [Bufo gargarizans]|uniref:uncharacterized protein LOC122925137 n=1 Tax=Bufo gargarizans TaxID=30331 RepID=UPI001CF4FB52|nr:uncharacterized protein LOC122925137 [Bufo gargarizans]XP_044137113.1 uncharacterized protein LOC122928390 [Bufo gargarizans]XP_044142130.1 uncharacterized protein LOC122932036 [Bufo gargarizans]
MVVASSLITKSLSISTLRSYRRAWVVFLDFQLLYPRGDTGQVKYMVAFVSYCHSVLALSYNTIRLYLAGVQHFLALQEPDRPSIFSAHPIKAILRGIQKSQVTVKSVRQPISGDTFRSLSEVLTLSPFGVLPSLVIKAAMYLAFYGFLRPGEVTQARQGAVALHKGDLVRMGSNFHLQLPHNKTRQVGPGHVVKFFQTTNAWCPVTVLDNLLLALSLHSPTDPLLPFPVGPLTSSQFIKHIRILLTSVGLNPAQFSGHSFRIGAASAASKHGVPAHIIKHLGRWRSGCFVRYIPEPQAELVQAFSKLAE